MHKLRSIVLLMMGWMLLLACSAETPAPTVAPANTAVPPTAEPTVAVAEPAQDSAEAAAPIQGVTLSGYENVVYTQDNADQLGMTDRAQLLNVYATW